MTFREGALCLVPITKILHILYGLIFYSIIPISFIIIIIYVYVYIRIHYRKNPTTRSIQRRNNRDMEILRNIIILLSIYIGGAIPTLIYLVKNIRIIFLICLVSSFFK